VNRGGSRRCLACVSVGSLLKEVVAEGCYTPHTIGIEEAGLNATSFEVHPPLREIVYAIAI